MKTKYRHEKYTKMCMILTSSSCLLQLVAEWLASMSERPSLKMAHMSIPRENMSLSGEHVEVAWTSGAVKSRSGWPILGSFEVNGWQGTGLCVKSCGRNESKKVIHRIIQAMLQIKNISFSTDVQTHQRWAKRQSIFFNRSRHFF